MVTPILPALLEPISKDEGRGRCGFWGRILQEPARGPRAGTPGCVCVSVPMSVRARVCLCACLLVCVSCLGAPQTENDLRAHVKTSLAAGDKSRLCGLGCRRGHAGPWCPPHAASPGAVAPAQGVGPAGPRGSCWPLQLLDTVTLLSLLSLCPEKKCYRESFVDDSPELDLPPAGGKDSGGRSCWRPSPHRSLHPAGSLGSFRVESKEMSVDGPLGTEALCGEALSCSSSTSHSSGDTDDSSRSRPERDTGDENRRDGEHVAGAPPAQSSLCATKRGCVGLTFLSCDGGPRPGVRQEDRVQPVEGGGGGPPVLSAADLGRPTGLVWVWPPESVSARFFSGCSCPAGFSGSPMAKAAIAATHRSCRTECPLSLA